MSRDIVRNTCTAQSPREHHKINFVTSHMGHDNKNSVGVVIVVVAAAGDRSDAAAPGVAAASKC